MLSHRQRAIQDWMIRGYRRALGNTWARALLRVYYPELGSIIKFVQFARSELLIGERLLDAGAGSQNYRQFFDGIVYESADWCETPKYYAESSALTYVCNLSKIPVESGTFDAVLNIQVLEHVPEPASVLKEFHRVLKPGGKLFLTAPQGWWLHDDPFHYFNFTCYGLRHLCEAAGFEIVFLTPRGGYFWNISTRLIELPSHFLRSARNPWLLVPCLLMFVISAPLVWCGLPPILYLLDHLDDLKKDTLGYAVYCRKI